MRILSFAAAAAAGLTALCGAEIKSGDSIAFLGDSITYYGWRHSDGYVRQCEQAFKANNLKVTIYSVGVSGNRSTHMLSRLQRDVLSKKPTYMTLSCGVNDVWHKKYGRGVNLPEYKKNITAIVDQAQKAGVKVIILAATMISENPDSEANKDLDTYNDFLRQLAKEKKCAFADLNGAMKKQIKAFRAAGDKSNRLTVDGVHMDRAGDLIMAEGVLKDGLKFTPQEMAKFQSAMKKVRHIFGCGECWVTAEEYAKIAAQAAAQKISVQHYIQRTAAKAIKALAK